MKARNFLWTSMINIFLVLLVSAVMEYGDLSSRFRQLDNIVSTAVDTSIKASTASEEFFTERGSRDRADTASFALREDDDTNGISNRVKILDKYGNDWIYGNIYDVAYFYDKNGRLPQTQGEIPTLTDRQIYEWLFGVVGSVYNDSSLSWANRKTKMWNASEWNGNTTSARTPTTNFWNFYNNVGKYVTSTVYLKSRVDSDHFEVVEKDIPTLTQMGLSLDSMYNDASSQYTNDYLSSSVHFGKSSNGLVTTSYYLTPYSLGVTYVPVEVLKPVLLCHLEQLIRFSKVKHTVTYGNASDMNDFAAANGCLTTDVYVPNAGGLNDRQLHKSTHPSSYLLNDGEIEYDLETMKVKVDYFYINDYYDDNNYKIVNRIEGATPHYKSDGTYKSDTSNAITNLPSRLRLKDTNYDKQSKRIVAKVSMKMKIHVPYKSSILQWFRQLNDKDGDNHYDLRLWDETSNGVSFDSDGVWYYYTTYYAITR